MEHWASIPLPKSMIQVCVTDNGPQSATVCYRRGQGRGPASEYGISDGGFLCSVVNARPLIENIIMIPLSSQSATI